MRSVSLVSAVLFLTLAGPRAALAQPDPVLYKNRRFRCIGPFRGGRSAAVTGVEGQPRTFYFGAAGGGVWRTEDGGNSWDNISDGYFGGSIGAVAVSPTNPNILYAGGGEKTVRGNVSHGYGFFRSRDGGKTWEAKGLEDSRRISRIRVHPRDPNVVYAAVMGHLFGPNRQRGVFRSTNGGDSWEQVLFVNDEVGATDLLLDPNNPRVIYASTWRIKRTPYSLESGGEGSGLWKSSDGGDNWTEITRNKGLPEDTVGIIGVAVSPVDSRRVWAIIESKTGGVFRSDDGGESWTRINSERKLRQRAWYYTRIYAGTRNRDEVYVLNVSFWRSRDGGKTYQSIDTPHGDHHDLWIDPADDQRMIIGDDGGAQVTYDGGRTWSTYHNQPTAQFYRVVTDNHFPYRIYGAQQDNSTVRILHRSRGRSITERDWESTAGGESGHIAPHPKNPDIVYGGSYGGYLTRVDHRTGARRNVNIWPDNPMGHGAADLKYRFQWNFPIFFSPHDANTLYAAAQVLFKTTNEGQTWTAISPDLTRDDKRKQGSSGGPITKDNTSIEYYATIFAALESPHEKGVIWTGSDDGLVHVTRDGGKSWKDVTPRDLPEWAQINSLEADPFRPGGLYLAATRYKLDDFRPYLFKTTDYGETWTPINRGIHRQHFTRVIRADPGRKGLLFAGTESGLYVSFDDGARWSSFQLNLPVVPVTDLAIKDNDLIIATQGRSFWLLDDLTQLHQLAPGQDKQTAVLYTPRPTYRLPGGGGSRPPRGAGENAPGGLPIFFYLREDPDDKSPVRIAIRDGAGEPICTYSTKPDKDKKERALTAKAGLNRLVWNTRYEGAEGFEGLVLWGGGLGGPRAAPGTYQVGLMIGEEAPVKVVRAELLPDPRSTASAKDYRAQFDFLIAVRDKLTETHRAIKNLRRVRADIKRVVARIEKRRQGSGKAEARTPAASPGPKAGPSAPVLDLAKSILERLDGIEKRLYQTQNRSNQDPLNFPIRLNNRLSAVVGVVATGDFPPTDAAIAVRDEVTRLINVELASLKTILDKDLERFNELVYKLKLPAVDARRD